MLEQAFQALAKLEYSSDDLGAVAQIDEAIVASHGDAAARAELEKQLLAVVSGGGTRNGKDYACRKLKVVGSDAAVPVLAGLLGDKELAHMARFALESLPSKAAGKALRDALPKLSGKHKVGVISSLGTRKDESSVATLAAALNDQDGAVARAAALALGAIRSSSAAKALSAAKPNPAALGAAVDSALACAESELAAGNKLQALKIYKQLAKGDQPKHIKLAATRGMLACAKS